MRNFYKTNRILSYNNTLNKQIFWFQLTVLLVLKLIPSGKSACPVRHLIKPCNCQEKTRGLDVTCEGNLNHFIKLTR